MLSDPSGSVLVSSGSSTDPIATKGTHQAFYLASQTPEEIDSWLQALTTNINR